MRSGRTPGRGPKSCLPRSPPESPPETAKRPVKVKELGLNFVGRRRASFEFRASSLERRVPEFRQKETNNRDSQILFFP